VQKILDAHLVEGKAVAGEEIGIRIDQTLTQDATGTMAYLQFEAMGFDRVKTDVSVSYVDHNTIQEGFENADDHQYLRTVAAKYGIKFSKAGNGICHQVHLERFGCPGTTLLGSDSHTPTGGGIGQIAIGAGGLDVAVAMGGGCFYLTCPRVIKVNLAGKLSPWVAAKDVILKVLEIISTKGNVGCVLEYGGKGVASLTVPERATITNMGAETGVTTSIFSSDKQTERFLKAQGRGKCYKPLAADADAAYDRVIDIDLSKLEPMVACPHSPGNVKTVREIGEIAVDQVLIGSCTNSSFRDLMTVAALLKGKQVAPSVSFGVAAGSRQVLSMIAENGALADIINAGARILESACGFCIGNSMAPRSHGISLRTNNRNFAGRSGTEDAEVYLCSPETAVASALAGTLVDPSVYFAKKTYPAIDLPEKFTIDDSMILEPPADASTVEIVRGPNIGDPPKNEPLPQIIEATVGIVVGDKITTDHIMPAGNRLKYRSNIPRYAEFVFERTDPEFARRALDAKSRGVQTVIVAGESYGQGSSREHAALCPMFLGVKMVIAKSMERIHRANLINFGIIPAVFADPADYDRIKLGDKLKINNLRHALERTNRLVVVNQTNANSFDVRIELSARERKNLVAGGLINATRGTKR
jgi:aconitate hydratase